jgi:hypothetical protein
MEINLTREELETIYGCLSVYIYECKSTQTERDVQEKLWNLLYRKDKNES